MLSLEITRGKLDAFYQQCRNVNKRLSKKKNDEQETPDRPLQEDKERVPWETKSSQAKVQLHDRCCSRFQFLSCRQPQEEDSLA